jgi:glyoxylase-like metal-dependent hydrolase (beta-lactamase superfamily II)
MRRSKGSFSGRAGIAAICLVFLFAAATGIACAQQNQSSDHARIHVLPAQGGVYMIVGPDANAAVQVGDQGLLVVDTMSASLSNEFLAAIAKLSDNPIRFIVNTSYLPEHTGGNEPVRKAGITITGANVARDLGDAALGSALIAHESVLDTMSEGKNPLRPTGAWPTDTFVGLRKAIFFNGEPVEILHIPDSTTDGSSMVWFRRADVVAAGDIFVTDAYPFIDLAHGGNINGVLDGLNHILEITVPSHEEEGGTLVIPGRGRLCDEADVVTYRDMITIIRNRVRNMIAKGMTMEQVKQAKPTFDFDLEYGTTTGPWTTDMFVEAVYKSLKK